MIGRLLSILLNSPLKLRSVLSVVLVVLAAASVRIGSGSTPFAMALAALAIMFALRRPPIQDTRANKRAWTAIVFVALVLSAWRAIALQELLDTGTDFLLLLCVQRFFNRRKTREHQQIILITGVLMTIGAVINVELAYPVLLIGYLITLVFSLIVNLLVAEGERLGPRVMYDLERIGERRIRRLLVVSVQVSGLVLVGGLAVFILFPRFGAGVFLRGALPTTTNSGFSNQVQLGLFGTIKSDPTVVMRVVPARATQAGDFLGWYFRGTSFDRYESGEWKTSSGAVSLSVSFRCRTHILVEDGTPRMTPLVPGVGCQDRLTLARGRALEELAVVSTITLEDLGVDILFLPDSPAGVRLHSRGLLERHHQPAVGAGDKLTVSRRQPGPLRYKSISRLSLPSDTELASVRVGTHDLPEEFLLTHSNVTPEFREVAASLRAGATNQITSVRAVLEYLDRLEYTLEQPEKPATDPRDPVEYFLFSARGGHCEYFATAAAMLLREMNIPTRLVNGYVGGTLNEYGGFYSVSQADAHSWIEVYFEGFGWLRFDPTPPDGRRGQNTSFAFPKLREYLDALRNKYLIFVIDYNIRTQLDLLSNLGLQWSDQKFHVDKERITSIATAMGGLLVLFVAIRFRRRKIRLSDSTKIMSDVIRRFAHHDLRRHEAETPQSFARRVSRAGFPAGEKFEAFIEEYERLRFSTASKEGLPISPAFRVSSVELQRAAKRWRRPK